MPPSGQAVRWMASGAGTCARGREVSRERRGRRLRGRTKRRSTLRGHKRSGVALAKMHDGSVRGLTIEEARRIVHRIRLTTNDDPDPPRGSCRSTTRARLWYAERDPARGRRFQAEYDRAIERVHDDPDRWDPPDRQTFTDAVFVASRMRSSTSASPTSRMCSRSLLTSAGPATGHA